MKNNGERLKGGCMEAIDDLVALINPRGD